MFFFSNLNMTSALIIPALSLSLSFSSCLSLSSSNDDVTENPIHGGAKSVIRSGKQDLTPWQKNPIERSIS